MKIKQRVLIILFICFVTLLLLTGCNKTSKKEPKANNKPTSKQKTAPKQKPKYDPPPKPPKQSTNPYDIGFKEEYSAGINDGKSESYGLALEEDLAGKSDSKYISGFKKGYEQGFNDYMGGALPEEYNEQF